MESSLNWADEEPGKSVSHTSRDAELLAALAGAASVELGDDAAVEKLLATASAWQQLFDHLPRWDVGLVRDEQATASKEFVRWWQDEALLSAGENDRRAVVPTRFETRAHHRIFRRIIEARNVLLELRGTVQLPDEYSLPCRTCGHIFKSLAPRFARTCDSCQRSPSYHQRLRPHRFGSLPVFAGGFHEKGSEQARYVWPTVCEHPDCVSVFLAKRWNDKYCSNHTRVSATRARQRIRVPKHKRFRFYPNYSECDVGTEVRYDLMIRGERRACVIGPGGYEARDEDEFRPLAHYAAQSPPRIHVVRVDAG